MCKIRRGMSWWMLDKSLICFAHLLVMKLRELEGTQIWDRKIRAEESQLTRLLSRYSSRN